ncbi:endo-1,4-beta-xylanase [Nostoc sp. FACHB-152]|uniref:endo-1,4-beta-xylanase n=1 Tax=unclassified Nostoc TaxID=2593658 RepID=UPI0016824865|nr:MULTISPECIES: endo-1,4-beta-xylanase [unclassified Nostoc]MBD2447496.1 endo-1,4-beta-xylanase [Nostoc sp. FACHB-152]MBD2468306.1 endo-1,4-beta-xylanase [Nostoc sp. FACHB-145]
MSTLKPLTRRQTIYLGLGALATTGLLQIIKIISNSWQIAALINSKRDFKVDERRTLKQRAASKGLIFGADCGTLNLQSDPKLSSLIAQECEMLVAGFLKWDTLRPTAKQFNFQQGDWYARFARQNRMLLRGHTLVWHESLPSWFKETVNRRNAEQFLIQHITQVVGRYAGQMHSWDVVNEAIKVKDGQQNGLRKTPWLEFLGENYIDLAFRIAAEVDPKALLVYNDYGLQYDIPKDEAKRNAVLKLLERLKSKGTPIHALGIQSHLLADETRFNPQRLRNFLKNVSDLGLKIMVTEMDVIDKHLPQNIAIRDRIVASVYEDYLSAILDEPDVIAVITWGLSDRYTWLSRFQPRRDKSAVRPLPFDTQMHRKLAWNAIARAFDNAPKR